MREVLLLKQLNRSYRVLNLRYSKLATAVALLVCTALLEMGGLSILYPLVRAMGSGGSSLDSLFAHVPGAAAVMGNTRREVIVLFVAVAILYVVKNGALYFAYRYSINFAMYYYRSLVRGLYNASVHKAVLEFRQDSAGSLANIICVQSGRLVDGVVRPLLVVVTESCLLVAIIIVICLIAPSLIALVLLTCGGAAVAYYTLMRGKALQWGKRRMQAAGSLQELVSSTAAGICEIKVFGQEDYLTSAVYASAVEETDMFRNLEMYQQGPRFLIEAVFIVTFVASFSLSLLSGTDLAVVLAQFSLIAAASFRILPSLNRLVGSYSSFSFNIGPALALMDTIMAAHLLVASDATTRSAGDPPVYGEGSIDLKDVSFQYPSAARPVLREVSWSIRKGERVGIIGRSGSGKSTLIELLGGLYAPTTGTVRAGGRSVSEDPKAWQAGIGYVPQTPFIMPETVRANVAFGAGGFGSDDDVWSALEHVGLATFVASLPLGIQTAIGEKGAGLSGGQKQLICMARALCRRPRLLLLDEPTAALDPANESMVLQALRHLPSATTIVMVSHRQENCHGFDSIYLCEHGTLRCVSAGLTAMTMTPA